MNSSLGQHGVVLKFRLSQSRAVAGDDDQLGLALSQRLEGGLVSQSILSTLDDKSQSGVDSLHCFLLLLARHD